MKYRRTETPALKAFSLFVVRVSVVYRFVCHGSLLGMLDSLDLMSVSEVGVVSCDNFIVVFVRLSGKQLMLGGCFEVMRRLAVIHRGSVMNFVLMSCGHRSFPFEVKPE